MYPAKEYLSDLELFASQICTSCIGSPLDDERWYELQTKMNFINEVEGAIIAKKGSQYFIDFFFLGKSHNRRHWLKNDEYEVIDCIDAETHAGWSLGHYEVLEKIASIDDALQLIYQVIETLKKDRFPEELPISLTSGPISTGGLGNRIDNLKVFAQTIWKLKQVGVLVVDQMPLEPVFHKMFDDKIITGEQLLKQFYESLLRSGKIYDMFAINSWETSQGAMFEYQIAKKIDMPHRVLPAGFHLMEEFDAAKFVAKLLLI